MEMNCMNLNDKKDIRRVILDQREKVDTGIRSEWDNIFFKLINSEFYTNSIDGIITNEQKIYTIN